MDSAKKFSISLQEGKDLIEKYGSPLYVYKKDIILENIKTIKQAAQGYHISYAMKANSNPEILKAVRDDGNGIQFVDVVSPGEILRALECGYQPHEILYTENFISPEEIDFAIQKKVILNIGALQTLKYYGKKLQGSQIFIRINPDKGAGQNYNVITGGPESKFGISSHELQQVRNLASQHKIKIIGLHQHIGSNLKKNDKQVFIETTKFILQKINQFSEVKYVNLGGGIGIKYRPGQQLLDIKELFRQIKEIKDGINKNIQLWIQPGRFIVANAGFLLCRITARKQTSLKVFYGTDTGFNHLIRPALYGSHHQIKNLIQHPKQKLQRASICGNICECTDYLGKDIMIYGEIGDILCIQNAGAYGFVMSSNYNQRPRPAQVMIQKQRTTLIRRRQTYQDLMTRI